MKLSEAEIQERQAAAQQRAQKIDELRLSVLKGHLLMEEALDGFIQAAVYHPEQLNHVSMNFHTKGHLAIALGLERDKDEMWSVVWAKRDNANAASDPDRGIKQVLFNMR